MEWNNRSIAKTSMQRSNRELHILKLVSFVCSSSGSWHWFSASSYFSTAIWSSWFSWKDWRRLDKHPGQISSPLRFFYQYARLIFQRGNLNSHFKWFLLIYFDVRLGVDRIFSFCCRRCRMFHRVDLHRQTVARHAWTEFRDEHCHFCVVLVQHLLFPRLD